MFCVSLTHLDAASINTYILGGANISSLSDAIGEAIYGVIEHEQHVARPNVQNIRRMVLVSVGVFALLVAGVFGLAVRAQFASAGNTMVAIPNTERVVIAIEGMHCGGCATGVKAMLKRTRGVVSAEVSFERKEAKVDFDSSATSREKIVEAINNMGYKASAKGQPVLN